MEQVLVVVLEQLLDQQIQVEAVAVVVQEVLLKTVMVLLAVQVL
jgi:hypothetical protein